MAVGDAAAPTEPVADAEGILVVRPATASGALATPLAASALRAASAAVPPAPPSAAALSAPAAATARWSAAASAPAVTSITAAAALEQRHELIDVDRARHVPLGAAGTGRLRGMMLL
jgi:hypothetical protein